MDYNVWAEMQHHHHPPNPNPPIDPNPQFHYPNSSSSSSTYPHSYYPPLSIPTQNPSFTDPNRSIEHYGGLPHVQLGASLPPPGVVDPYTYHPPLAGYEAQTTAAALYRQQVQNWAAGTFHADASTSKVVEPSVPAKLNAAQLTKSVVQPSTNGVALKKGSKKNKKNKIVQFAYCDICKIECTSLDIFAQHKLGKKHKKNLEKLEEANRLANQPPPPVIVPAQVIINQPPPPVIVPPPVNVPPRPPPPVVTNPAIGPPENPTKRKKAASSSTSKEDLETKKRKLMEGGAAAEAVRVCIICNVACNSETVFNYHLAGQKHAAMVKKRTAGTSAVGVWC